MSHLRFSFFLFSFLAISLWTAFADDKSKLSAQVLPRGNGFSISKETTFFLGPLTKEGYLDYVTALNKALAQDVLPEENANIPLWKIIGPKPEGGKGMPPEYFDWLGMKAPPDKGNYYLSSRNFAKEVLKIPRGQLTEEFLDQMTSSTHRPWKESQYSNIALWLKHNKDHLANLAEAVKRKKFYNPSVPWGNGPAGQGVLNLCLLQNIHFCRELAATLASRAMLHLGEGRPDEAWQDVLTCLRLGRLIGQGGSIIEGLVGLAVETIGHEAAVRLVFNNPGQDKIRVWQKDLATLPPRADIRQKFNLVERTMFLDSLQHVTRLGPKDGMKFLDWLRFDGQQQIKGLPEKFGSVDWDPAFRMSNLWFNRIYAQMGMENYAERKKRWGELEQEIKDLNKEVEAAAGAKLDPRKTNWSDLIGKIAVARMMPGMHRIQGAFFRVAQSHTNLEIAMALALYKTDKGNFPATLDALTPKYISKIPNDLFSDKPLKYKVRGEGFLLHSVGLNGRDEGGLSSDGKSQGDDPAIRVPIPKPKP